MTGEVPRPLVKRWGGRWVVMRPVAPGMWEHVSDHETHAQALAAAEWWVYWHTHQLRALDVIAEHLVLRYHRAAHWVHRHWGTP